MGVEDWIRARFKPWQAVAVAVVLLASGLLLVGRFAPDDYTEQADDCREMVESSLRTPATAEFGDVSVATAGDTVQISGAVDSENGFGATVRSDYRCEFTDGSSHVTLARLETR